MRMAVSIVGKAVYARLSRDRYDVDDLFSPTVLLDSVRCLLQIAVSYDCWAFSLDLAGAYLYANPSRIVYLRAPGHLQDILDPSEIPMTPS